MKLSFYGAAGEVTGSCYLVETDRARVLVDFGLHQGGREQKARNLQLPPLAPERLDCIVVTHAHLDHTGRLPLLANAGFSRPIYCTPATKDLAEILLMDAASIQQSDAERATRRNQRRGLPAAEALYGPAQAAKILDRFVPLAYEQAREVAPGITVRLADAGHILGSASIEMKVVEAGGTRTIVFSGDLGPSGVPLLRDPTPLRHADLVVMESTYGDRDHRPLGQTVEEMAGLLREAVWSKEKVLIPSFAVGRSQLLLYFVHELEHSGRVPRFPVFLDSPMAIKALELYRRHVSILDKTARQETSAGDFPLDLDGLVCTTSVEQSREINAREGAAIIIAGSGMCTGGRILHHLRHNIWRRDVHLLFVGFQAEGTLGRAIVDGAKRVRIFGEPIIVRANVHTLNGFSAHAGQTGLVGWASNFETDGTGRRPRFALTHGEPGPRATLAGVLRARLGIEAELPEWGASLTL